MQNSIATQQRGITKAELLPPEEFASWDALVSKSPHGTIFHYSWWLEATGYDFEILICRDGAGDVVAGIPLPRKRRLGLTLFHSPRLTPYLGPIFDLSKATTMRGKLSRMRCLGESLACAIKGYDSLRYSVSPDAPDLQGFLWTGFRVELAYTFHFERGSRVDQVLRGMAQAQRSTLSKAQRSQAMVEADDNIDMMMELHKQTFSRLGLCLPYPESLPRRLWAAARSRGHANIYLSRTAEGVFAAGVLVVHDARSSYSLLGGMNPEVASSGGSYLVDWNSIRDSLLAGRAFDFEGSSLRGVELYFRRLGAVPKPVWRLEKAGTLRGALARALAQRRNTEGA